MFSGRKCLEIITTGAGGSFTSHLIAILVLQMRTKQINFYFSFHSRCLKPPEFLRTLAVLLKRDHSEARRALETSMEAAVLSWQISGKRKGEQSTPLKMEAVSS